MNEGIYWPGTEIVRSTHNGFTMGLSQASQSVRRTSYQPLESGSKAGRIRAFLEAGPRTGRQIADEFDLDSRNIAGILANDIKQGRIRKEKTVEGTYAYVWAGNGWI